MELASRGEGITVGVVSRCCGGNAMNIWVPVLE